MVLLENLILLLILAAVMAFSQLLCVRLEKKLIPAIISGVAELVAVILLLYRGAALEELFLTLLVFGAISVSVYYYAGETKKADAPAENEDKEADGK